MTNRPKFPERAEVVRAVAEATNGHGVPMTPGGIALPKVQQVEATSDAIFAIADAMCAGLIIGRPVTLRSGPDGKLQAQVPHLGQMLARMREEWKEPTPLQAAKLALVEAMQKCQESVYALAPTINAERKAEEAAAKAAAEATPPCPTCNRVGGHVETCPDRPA